MTLIDTKRLQEKINTLGEWWEAIDFGEGIKTGPGRSKKLLWKKLKKNININLFYNKKILDLGCNAGGNIIELNKFNAKEIVGVEGSDLYFKQAEFVMKYFNINANVLNTRFTVSTTPAEYKELFGSFDIIFCFGLIYHFNEELNLNLLRYIKKNSNKAYFSTQTFINKNRTGVDWDTTKEGTYTLFRKAGYTKFKDIYNKSPSEDWSACTNDWYFSAE